MERTGASLLAAGVFAVALWIDSGRRGSPPEGSLSNSPEAARAEAMRFAASGRVKLRRIVLYPGRSAETVVQDLSALSRESTPGIDARFKQAFCIPPHQRGNVVLRFETTDRAIQESAQRAADCIEALVAPRWLPAEPIRVRALPPGKARAHAIASERSIHLAPGRFDIGTAIHEIAHHIEFSHPEILHASKLFIARRGHDAPVRRLSQLTGDPAYEPHEVAVAGNWPLRGGLPYSGKFYGDSLREATATEAVSTGVERLLREPRAMFRDDPDYFLFLLLTLGQSSAP
jgi:hypothetical protein